MPQFPIPPGKKVGQSVTLSPADAKHLVRVLRARPGETIRLFDGQSRFEARLVAVSPREATAKITSLLVVPKMRGAVTLGQALLKKDKMEWIVQKAVELGATALQPFISERTLPTAEKTSRWQKIADEALKQCGRIKPLQLMPAVDFSKLLQGPEKKILFHEEGEKINSGFEEKMTLLIGPEGGFSDREVEAAKKQGCAIGSLGPLTLRAETAAVAALALIQHELGNL